VTRYKDIAAWVQQLSAPRFITRYAAAAGIYNHGMALLMSAEAKLGTLEFASHPDVVGVAVTPTNFDRIRTANESPPLATVPPDQDAIEFELNLGEDFPLDILTTKDLNGQGAIARFLRKSGEGIQQIERYVRDVDQATDVLRRGFGTEPIYPTTRAGANGTRVNFFLVPTEQSGKVLIELVEQRNQKHGDYPQSHRGHGETNKE
jgi:methylmalonyl-CoA/ethylmalonyl-CoA epimerase